MKTKAALEQQKRRGHKKMWSTSSFESGLQYQVELVLFYQKRFSWNKKNEIEKLLEIYWDLCFFCWNSNLKSFQEKGIIFPGADLEFFRGGGGGGFSKTKLSFGRTV